MNIRQWLILPWIVLFMTGCVGGQRIDVGMKAQQDVAASTGVSVALLTKDQRPYVVSGKKSPAFIGVYRAIYGHSWDVTTQDDIPLARVMHKDLLGELRSLGYQDVAENQARNILVEIHDWNFDAYAKKRLNYSIRLNIKDAMGKNLYQKHFSGEETIEGDIAIGARHPFEKEMPFMYQKILKSILRDNQEALAALKG